MNTKHLHLSTKGSTVKNLFKTTDKRELKLKFNISAKGLLLFCFYMLSLSIYIEVHAQCYTSTSYCVPVVTNINNYNIGIQNVTLGSTINNSSVATGNSPYYFDYTTQSVTSAAAATISGSVTNGSSNSTGARIFIDYNQDGIYSTSAPELVWTSPTTTPNAIVALSFTIPVSQPVGVYRMRITGDLGGQAANPCTLGYGEIEDYTLLIPSGSVDVINGGYTSPNYFVNGNNTIGFSFKNISGTTITSATIGYQLGSNIPITQILTGLTIGAGASFTASFTTPLNISATGSYNLKTWVSNPNSATNITPGNDTICRTFVTYCSAALSGTYTINPAGSGTTNFTRFGAADSALLSCGVLGPVTFNVAAGTYNEQILFGTVPGVSAVNTITFDGGTGGASTHIISYNFPGTPINYGVIHLNGSDYFIFKNLTFQSTSTNYGYGVLLSNAADNNIIDNCTIDLGTITNGSASNSAGINFSSSFTGTSSSANHGNNNIIRNCQIIGSASGGPYRGINLYSNSSATGSNVNNQFINNNITNFFESGIYMYYYLDGTVIRGNNISRPDRTSSGTVYGINASFYFTNTIIEGNKIFNPFGGALTSGNGFYGIAVQYGYISGGTNVIRNNAIFNINGNGTDYGIYDYYNYAGMSIYNNTISLDYATPKTNANPDYGIYLYYGSNGSRDLRNNIVTMRRGGTANASRFGLYLSDYYSGLVSNYNLYLVNAPLAGNIPFYQAGINYQSLAAWKASNSNQFDQNSVSFDPIYNNIVSNVTPTSCGVNNLGTPLTGVTTDISGTARGSIPDLGAYEFTTATGLNNGSLIGLDAATSLLCAGGVNAIVTLKNEGTGNITSAKLDWTVNSVAQTQYVWSGNLAPGASINVNIGIATFTANSVNTLNVYITQTNGSPDACFLNDTAKLSGTSSMSGNYTIDAAGSGLTNFTSFTAAVTALITRGVCGPVTMNAVAGTYNQQINITSIAGSSALNTITFTGAGSATVLTYSATTFGSPHTIRFDNAQWIRFKNISVIGTGVNYSWPVHIYNNSSNIQIRNCIISSTASLNIQTNTNFCGVAITNATTSLSGSMASFNIDIDSNVIQNNWYGISMYGSFTAGINLNIYMRNNKIDSAGFYGINAYYLSNVKINNNAINMRMGNGASTTSTAISLNNCLSTSSDNIQVNRNKIINSAQFGIYLSTSGGSSTTQRCQLINNAIGGGFTNAASTGIYFTSANYWDVWHNSVNIDNAATGISQAIYLAGSGSTYNDIRNNNFSITHINASGAIAFRSVSGATTNVLNYNNYYKEGAGSGTTLIVVSGSNYTPLNYNTATSGGTGSFNNNSNFTFSTNLLPTFSAGKGFLLSQVSTDITDFVRNNPPDLGAYELSSNSVIDAGLITLISPDTTLSLGSQNVSVVVRNFGSTTITSFRIRHTVNGLNLQDTLVTGISLAQNSSITVNMGISKQAVFAIAANTFKVYLHLPNGSNDNNQLNDTISIGPRFPAMSGVFTINPVGSGANNFISFTNAVTALNGGGVSGPVKFNVSAATYTEQIDITGISGSSAINTVTFDGGAGNAASRFLQYTAPLVTDAHTVRFTGSSYVTFRNITIKALGTSYGLAVHFMGAASFINIQKCSLIVATSTNQSVRPVQLNNSNNSLNGGQCGGTSGAVHDISIDSNYISGGYEGVYLTSNYTVLSSTPLFNFRWNIMENMYNYAFNIAQTSGYNIQSNLIKLSAGNSNSSGIYHCNGGGGSPKIYIVGNTLENIGNNGVQFLTANIPAGSIIATNYFKPTFSSAAPAAIVMTYTSGLLVYHNTILMNIAGGNGITVQGISGYTGNDVRNNLIILQSPVATGLGLSFETGELAVCNTNTIVKSNPVSADVARINGVNYQNSNFIGGGGFNTNSFTDNPILVSIADPRPNSVCQKGVPITFAIPGFGNISRDILGIIRNNPPQVGAAEPAGGFSIDANLVSFISPVSYPVVPGAQDVKVVVKNAGNTSLTSYSVSVTLGAVTRTIVRSAVSLITCAVDTVVFTGANQLTLISGVNVITARVSSPNGGTDFNPANDTLSRIFVTPLNGTYTINSGAAVSATNFQSVVDFAYSLNNGGMSGAVVANVVTGSGPYTGQVEFRRTTGMSVVNTVTINGNNNIIQASPDATNCYIIFLNGADYMRFNNLTIRTLNVSYGIGYLFQNRADSNIIDNNTIDFGNILTNSTAFIAFSASTNSPTGTGGTYNGINNVIKNCTMLGNGTGGPTYGITVMGGTTDYTSTTLAQYNQFINNDMRDPSQFGFYINFGNRNLIKGNKISMPTRTTLTSFYGIYSSTNYIGDTIDGNQIFDIYKSVPTNTSQFYGMYNTSAAFGNSAYPQLIRNNIIYNIKGQGGHYGFYNANSYYYNLYHNTVVLDDPSTTTNASYAYYLSAFSTTYNSSVKNNIFYINRGGTGVKYCIYIPSAFTPSGTFTINNNAFYVNNNSVSGYVGYYAANFPTLTNWKTANSSAFDQLSVFANPNFRTYIAANYFQPANDTLNNIGSNLQSIVPVDITGLPRSNTPDPGIYEFSLPSVDVGLTRITAPVSPISVGFQNVNVTVKNFSPTPLTSTTVGWSVNDTVQTPNIWSGYLVNGDSNSFTVGGNNFTYSGLYKIKAWSSLPNNIMDSFTYNDTVIATVCTPLSGTLTVNATLPATSTNFQSITALAQLLQLCGITGAVQVNIAPGTYNGQVTFNNIPGSSATNTITFAGGDSAICNITHNGTVQRATLLLNGAKNLVFRNITFDATGSASATAVQLINSADSNTFVRCTFRTPVTTSGSVNSFVASGSLITALAAGNSANYLLVDSCTSTGGYYGMVLYGNTSPKGIANIIRNSTITNSYNYGVYLNNQNSVQVIKNNINNTGLVQNNTFPFGLSLLFCDNANKIIGNSISGTLGGYGIYLSQTLGTSTIRTVIANNMIQIGAGVNVTYGIYETSNAYTDIVFNTVKLNTAESGYTGAALYTNASSPSVFNNVNIVNNIFLSPFGSLAVYTVTPANLGTASYTIDNNVYYSTATYPFRGANTIFGSLANYRAAGINSLGSYIPSNNSHSQYFMPTFFSAANLRSISTNLNDSGVAVASILTDIDGSARSSTPDIGILEFSQPANDAGAVAILTPVQPLIPGLSDIYVLITNFGTSSLTSVNVTYQIDTAIRTLTYSGTILPGASDTARFNSISGLGGTSQRYNFLGGLKVIRAWTSMPNASTDSITINDTTQTTICGALGGAYTINPLGSGSTNFVSIQAAVDKLICGGVYAPVIFNIASGTYNGQITIPVITGTNATNTILFKSANNNATSVMITSNTSGLTSNYTLNAVGLQYVTFRYLSFQNLNTSYSRVVSINKFTAANTNSSELEFRDCIFNGQAINNTADQYCIIYGPTGEFATNLRFINNTFNNGSSAIVLGGQNIVNNFTPGLTVDSCTFMNQYYAALFLTNRGANSIRQNIINLSAAYTGAIGIYLAGSQNESFILRNNIQNPSGNFGIYLVNHAYYAATGILNIAHNVINMQSSSATEYGVYIVSSSQISCYNNTIRTNASSSFGFYVSGNPSFVNGTTFPATNNLKFFNNLIVLTGGVPLFLDLLAKAGTNLNDYNLYYTSGTNMATLAGVNYSTIQSIRNVIYMGSDANSLNRNVAFTSATNLRPDTTSANAWNVNGRGNFNNSISYTAYDITGRSKSNTVETGVPDIGAYEITPSSMPFPITITGSIGYGNTQFIVEDADTLGNVLWGFTGTLPSTVAARYFPGSLISNPAAYRILFPAKYLDMHYRIDATGGSSYTYDVNWKYKPNMLGTVTSESAIKFAKRDTGATGVWSYFSFSTVLDTLNKYVGATNLTSMSDFTGTDDISPLPVILNGFNALRTKDNAELFWQTASEINSNKFIIERSEKISEGFVKIAEIKAAGNSKLIRNYEYTDVNAAKFFSDKTVYYRLKIVDRDGSFDYSTIKSVFFGDTESATLQVYPNPFISELTLQVNVLENTSANILIYDIMGKVVYTELKQVSKGISNFTIDKFAGFPAGLYIVKLSVSQIVITQKLIKH
ncbi:MAG: T9SS type A sorting domain-containing protein [Bacteroidia bacterium]|nr:T9SS type A sorting domain-containing protein [Bacteroidia bacterium]